MRMMMGVIGALIFFNSCSMRFVKVENPESVAQFLAKIDHYNKKIQQVKASLDIKGSGVMKSVVHEQADIVVKDPKYLYWSLRSFFGPPVMIMASNGDFLTAYDFSGQRIDPYQKIALKNNSFISILDFYVHPQSFIYMFLAKIPLQKSEAIQVKIRKNIIEITATLKSGWQMVSLFDHEQNHLLSTRLSNELADVSYQVTYMNFKKDLGIDFPRLFVLTVNSKSQFFKFTIDILHIEINGSEVSSDTFYVKPH